MKTEVWMPPFACRMISMARLIRRQGSAMNSLCSALTALLAGPTRPPVQAKGVPESLRRTSDILAIELVQNTGLVNH